ncbi:unnamed protein product [Musa hybrid cultivar]
MINVKSMLHETVMLDLPFGSPRERSHWAPASQEEDDEARLSDKNRAMAVKRFMDLLRYVTTVHSAIFVWSLAVIAD